MEHWRTILDGYYEVSDLGNVRRIAGGRGAAPNKLLRFQSKDGYRSVPLSVRGHPKRYYVHRLVAVAFRGPVPAGHVVNHIDGDRWNAALSNLEYVTYQQNGVLAGQAGQLSQGERHTYAKLTVEQVMEARRLHAEGIRNIDLCRRYGVVPSTMHHVLHQRTWKSVK